MTGGGGNVKARDTQAFREDEPLPSTSRPHTTNVVSVRPLSNARQGISRPIGHIVFVRTYRAARYIAPPHRGGHSLPTPVRAYRVRQDISCSLEHIAPQGISLRYVVADFPPRPHTTNVVGAVPTLAFPLR